MKKEEGDVIDRGSTAGGPHLNWGKLRRAERFRRYARLRVCIVAYLRVEKPLRVPENKIFDRTDVMIWNVRLSNSHDLAISEKVKACKLSATIIWLASKNKLNNPN